MGMEYRIPSTHTIVKTKAAKSRCTLCLPVAVAAALLSSCVATHRQVFDYGREGGGVLLKGNTQETGEAP